MSITSWFTKLLRSRDAAAMRRAEERAEETPAERAVTSGDIDAIKADERAAELTGDTPTETRELGD